MKAIYTYFVLELKKGFRLSLRTLGSMLVMLIMLIAGTFLVSHFVFQSTVFEKLNVGMVIPKEEGETRLISQVMSAMESVNSICEFSYLEQEEALIKLEAGELQAVISLPDSFYQDVYTGINTPATVYFPYNSNLNQLIFKELILDGVSILQTSESAVYAFLDVANDQELLVEPGLLGDVIAMTYIKTAFNRGHIFNETMLSSMGSFGIYEYYFAAAMTIMLLLCGLNYGYFYKKENKAVEQKLKIYGLTKWKQGLVKVAVMTFFLWIFGTALYFAGCLISRVLEIDLLWFDSGMFGYLLPLCFGIAAFFHLIYQLGKDGMQGAVLLLLLTIGMILCSGAVIPIAYLPKIVGSIGQWLPLTFWNQYCAQALFDVIGWQEIGIGVGIGFLEYGIGELVSWRSS